MENDDWVLTYEKGRDIHPGTFVEAICKHGVGHHWDVHGCDGCCSSWPQEISDNVSRD